MRKRVLAKILAVCMALSVLSTTALADWVSLTQSYIDENDGVLTTGDYRMDEDISTDKTVTISGENTVTIDLNGKTLEHTGETGSVISVTGGADLTIEDSSGKNSKTGKYEGAGEGKITGGKGTVGRYLSAYGGGVYVSDTGSTVTMNGGNITENSVKSAGGGVYLKDGAAFTLNGGKITQNTTSMGGGVFATGSTVTVNGGEISNNTVTHQSVASGGGLAIQNSHMNLTGGTISNNTAHRGGGIYVYDNSTMNMTGGSISQNTANANSSGIYGTGGGIEVWKSTLNMSGGTISGNTANGKYAEGGGVNLRGGSAQIGNTSQIVLAPSHMTMTGGSITDNTVTGDRTHGGGISMYDADLKLEGGTISNNTAGYGGGIAGRNEGTNYTTVHISTGNSSITGNTATTGNGGGIYISGGSHKNASLTIGDKTGIGQNTGSGIYISNLKEGKLEGNVYFSGNTGDNIAGKEADVKTLTEGTTGTIHTCENGDHCFSDPTCVQDSACIACGLAGELKATGHQYGSWTENADGTYTHTCTACGASETQGDNPHAGQDHNYGSDTTNPDGTHDHTCEDCGHKETYVPKGGTVTGEDGNETTYPDGAAVDKDGNITTGGKEITKDKDTGDVTIKDGENETKVDSNDKDVTVNPDGSVEVPEGGTVTDKDGNETTYPGGATIDPEGNITTEGKEITKGKDTGDVTIKDGENETKVDSNGKDVTVNPDGSVEVPEGGAVTDKDDNETTYPGGATIDPEGNITTEGKEITKDKDTGDVTIKDGEGETKIDGNGEDVTVNPDGSVEVPEGGTVTDKDDNETTYPGGATIDPEGNITTEGKEITKDKDTGDVTIKDGEGETKVDGNGEDVTVNPDGSVEVPAGGTVTDKDGNETTYPGGASVDKDGNITTEGKEITKDKGTGDVTIKDGEGETKVDGNGEDVTVNPDGSVEVPEGGTVTDKDGNETTYPGGASVDKDGNITTEGKEITKDKDTGDVTIKDGEGETKVDGNGEDVTVNPDGSVEVPEGGKIDGVTYPDGATIGKDGTIKGEPEQSDPADPGDNNDPSGTPDPETPDVSVPGGDDGFGGAAETTINEAEVPLAGIMLVKDVLAELYKHEGNPDGADAEGEYVKAIAWAITNGIAAEDDDVEAVVTVAVLKEMLTNYAALVGGELTVTIDGEDDDVVMNCGEILAEVFETL